MPDDMLTMCFHTRETSNMFSYPHYFNTSEGTLKFLPFLFWNKVIYFVYAPQTMQSRYSEKEINTKE